MDPFEKNTPVYVKEDIANPVATALKTAFLVIGAMIVIATIFNVPLYFAAHCLPLAQFGLPAQSFLEIWPFSYIGAAFATLFALTKYVVFCGQAVTCTWYLM